MAEKQQPTAQKKEGEAGPSNGDKAAGVAGEKKKLPQLGALEDDDEFEDFPANADNSGTILDALKNSGAPGDHLWEDNWDDDDVEDDFTMQLRAAIEGKNGQGDEAMKA